MAGFKNSTLVAKNADYTQADGPNANSSENNGLVSDGKLWIGSTALNAGSTHINVGSLTSTDSSITIGYSTPNITLVVNGSAVGKTITGNSGGSLSPVLGNWNIFGSVTGAGTNPVSTAGAGNTLTVNVQRSQAIGAADITKLGLSNFNSAQFTVDANGFVSLLGGGEAIDSIHPDSGTDPVVPTAAGLVNIVGSGSTTTVGSLNTLTVQLTGLTNHSVLVGAGTTTITKVGPTATAGQVLQSAGASADPAFSTATYPLTTTVSQILYSSATNTVTGLATANNSILSTDGSGVPSLGTSLNNDYTFTASTAGTVRTLTVTNTDNTNTASAALIKAVSGGASAGDGFYQASTTTTVWSFGVDNSVTSPTADPFVISQGTALGTNNIMSVATSGEINYPLQPAFLTYLASDIGNVTGDGTAYTIVFDTEVFDQNGDLSGATFTAPVTGRYALYGGAKVEAVGAANTQGFLSIITSNREYRDPQVNATVCKTGGSDLGMTISCLCDMDANDTAVLSVSIVGGTKTVAIGGSAVLITYFSGNLTA